MYTSVSAVRSSQSIMKAMARAPGPASTMPASTPVALGTASMGGAASTDRASLLTPGPCSRRAPLFFLGELFGLVLVLQGIHELVELALHDVGQLVQREVDAVVGDAALREIVRADAFRAVAGAHLQLAVAGDFTVAL